MAIARNISINDETYELEPSKGQRVYVGTCSTGAATNPKVCTVETFPVDGNGEPYVGTEIVVKFTATNSSTSTTPQLNVNGTGAIRIWYNNAVLASAKSAFAGYANRYMRYVYDGTYWVFLGHSVDNNTTYSAMSDAEINAGTSTTARLMTPARLRTHFYTEGEVDALLGDKQDVIDDLEAIRSGASKGATAIQQADLAAVATSGSYNDLADKPTIPAAYDDTALAARVTVLEGQTHNVTYNQSTTTLTIQ